MSQQSTVSASVPSPSVIDTMTRIIMSQTDMSEEEVKKALEHTNYDLKRVIREYMIGETSATTVPTRLNTTTTSPNQMRFSEIRNFMDKSVQQYYRQQEMIKIYNQVLEKKKAAAAASSVGAAATEAATDATQASKL